MVQSSAISHECGLDYLVYSIPNLVVGSGAAGLNAAVSLVKEGVPAEDIAILTEGRWMGTSHNTGSDKQTYYKMTTCGSEPESVRRMAQTLYDGTAVDGDLALAEAALSLRGFYHLVDIGVPFPCNRYGEYVGYKTDHDPNQRGTSVGPLTSKWMTEALWKEAERYKIPVFDGYQIIELLTTEDEKEKRVCGAVALNRKAQSISNAFCVFSTENIVYATGGEAGMYATSVYPVSQTGGTGTALRAGAPGKNLTESQYGIASIKFRWNLSGTYQQVLPCYVSAAQDGSDEREFLGEYFDDPKKLLQAIFLKGYQWPFDPRKVGQFGSSLIDLLVYQETVLRGRRVFLDFRKNPSQAEENGRFAVDRLSDEARAYLQNSDGLWQTPIERLEHMNPAAIELYRDHNIDLYNEPLEIAVCAQHNNGGLAGNCWWESELKHLFPVGEVNGSHGVYRPGGSALNAGQVGSLRAAQYIAHAYRDRPISVKKLEYICGEQIRAALQYGLNAMETPGQALDLKQERALLGERMNRAGANIRSLEKAEQALTENEAQRQRVMQGHLVSVQELAGYYRLRDLLFSQKVYLEAIRDYIRHGGKSRGSYLIYDPDGVKPLESLPEMFRCSLEQPDAENIIQETEWTGNQVKFTWRSARPLPPEDSWFEEVWRNYREDRYYR